MPWPTSGAHVSASSSASSPATLGGSRAKLRGSIDVATLGGVRSRRRRSRQLFSALGGRAERLESLLRLAAAGVLSGHGSACIAGLRRSCSGAAVGECLHAGSVLAEELPDDRCCVGWGSVAERCGVNSCGEAESSALPVAESQGPPPDRAKSALAERRRRSAYSPPQPHSAGARPASGTHPAPGQFAPS